MANLSASMFLHLLPPSPSSKDLQFLGHHHHSFYPFQQLTLPKFLLMFLSGYFKISVWFFSWPPVKQP